MRRFLFCIGFSLLYVSLSFSQKAGLNFLLSKNEFSIDGSIIFDLTSKYRIKVNTIGVSLITKDIYNKDTSNMSLFTMYNSGPIFILGLTWLILSGDKAGKWIDYIMIPVVAPLIASLVLTNSQHHFVFINPNPDSESSFDMSLFFRTKLDYYDSQKTIWFRYKPGIGLEINKKIPKVNMGLSLSIGYEKPFDYVNHKFNKNNFRSFGGIMASIYFE